MSTGGVADGESGADKAADDSPPEAGSSRPVSSYLFFLVLIGLVPSLLFSGFLLIRTNQVQQDGLETLFQASTSSLVQVIEQEVGSMLTTLRVLSSDPTFAEGDMEAFHDRARRALVGRGLNLVVIDRQLRQVMNTSVDYGEQLGPLTDRTTPQRAFERRTPVISDTIFSQSSLRWVVYAALPIFPEGGEPILLALARSADSFGDTIKGRLPQNWNVAIVDSQGMVVDASDEALRVGGPLPFDIPESFSSGITRFESGGDTYQLIGERSVLTPWTVFAWAPVSTINSQVLRSILFLIAGGIAIGTGAAIAAWFVGRRVSRSARRLAGSARQLGAGEPVKPSAHTISEFAVISTALTEAAHDRAEAENEIRLLMREVAHRSKNQLTVINAMVGQTAKNATHVDEFVDSFRRRISGLARSTDLLLANTARGIDFRALIESQLEPFMPSDPERVTMKGPKVAVDAQPAQTLGMAVHELATNAAKYGALADEESRLEISWWRREGRLSLTWREYVTSLKKTPERKGFGSVVLERMMGGTLDAEITRTLHDNGIEWHFAVPLERLRTHRDS